MWIEFDADKLGEVVKVDVLATILGLLECGTSVLYGCFLAIA